MTESQFEEFLSKTIKNFGDDYIDFDESWNEPHEFSERFERRMRKLFRQRQHFYFPLIKTRTRRTITIISTIAVLSSVAVMSVGAAKGKMFGFSMKKSPKYTVVTADMEDKSTQGFDKIYEITKLPDGFEQDYKSSNDLFLTTEYRNNDKYIRFEQWKMDYYQTNENTEIAKAEIINVGNVDGYLLYSSGNDYEITWLTDNYVFKIISNIDIETVYSIIESVKECK